MEQITKLVMTGNIDRAIKLCGAAPNAALARVIKAGLSRANRGEIEVARAMEESILEVTPPCSGGFSRCGRWPTSPPCSASSEPSPV